MKRAVLILILAVVLSGCSVKTIYHDEDIAIDVANKFLLNIIKGNYSDAYNKQIGDRLKDIVSLEQFEEGLRQSAQVRGAISKALFDSFEPVPGQRAIQLFYNVYHENEVIMYHFVLEGDGKAGYRIILLDIGNQMRYPPNTNYAGIKPMGEDISVEITADGVKDDN